jgi:REP element-mobilizing transposase RayT
MGRPLKIEFPGAVYHVTARGNARQTIFHDDKDRSVFLEVLGKVIARHGWVLHGFCLMGNHYHLLLETPDANLSAGMRTLNGRYTAAFNRRHRRVGHLFQGRFTSILVEKESHLLELCRYVVLNPVGARGMKVKLPEEWPWSSYRATAGKEKPPEWLSVSWILGRFGRTVAKARRGYRRFVAQGLKSRTKIEVRSSLWIGSSGFGERLKDLAGDKVEVLEHPRRQRQAVRKKSLEQFFPEAVGKERSTLEEAVYRAYREGRFTQKEIRDHLGIHYVTVSKIVRKIEQAKRA